MTLFIKESLQIPESEEPSARSLMQRIRRRLDNIQFPLILTSYHDKAYPYTEDTSLFSGEDFRPESEGIVPADIKEILKDLSEIQNLMREAKEIENRTVQLQEEEAVLLPELLDKLLRDHPKKNVLKQVLIPK